VRSRTRRLVFLAAIVLAISLPAESILLNALTGQSDSQVAEQWAADLSDAQVSSAGDHLRGYSYPYRREILKRASANERVRIIRAHIQSYIDANAGLDAEVRELLAAVQSAATARALSQPNDEDRLTIDALGDRVEHLLGHETAGYLLVWFGPKETGFLASRDPLRLKLAKFVRDSVVVSAGDGPSCDCVPTWGCYGEGEQCAESTVCRVDLEWPKCGWLWDTDCTHLCVGP
jgi:hypothetical protein